jgi:hypothetical protein
MAKPQALTKTPATQRDVSAEANAQFLQHSLNELLLGEEALTPMSSQMSYIAQQAHQRFNQAANQASMQHLVCSG